MLATASWSRVAEMPRDAAPPSAVVEVALPAGRRGRIVAADDAGVFRIICRSTWLDELQATGWVNADEADAATMLHQAFESSGLRPHLAARLDVPLVDRSPVGDNVIEAMTADELKHWRKLHRLLQAVPSRLRHQVEACACWGQQPWDVRSLRAGLAHLAAALCRPRR